MSTKIIEKVVEEGQIIYKMNNENEFTSFRKGMKDKRIFEKYPECKAIYEDIHSNYTTNGVIDKSKNISIKFGNLAFFVR